ncbi:hypothetical protein [Natrialba swarupiae]|uniref:hypothetical protein n=1 Tax=Natrialba swarupiae TaxID=2448032 RepID=UPI0030830F25
MAYTLHYYDIVLICIAVSIATAGVVGTMTTIALEFAVVVFGGSHSPSLATRCSSTVPSTNPGT